MLAEQSSDTREPSVAEDYRDLYRPITHYLPETLNSILKWDLWNTIEGIESPRSLLRDPLNCVGPMTLLSNEYDFSKFTIYLNNFFDFVHVKNPILDERETRSSMKQMSIDGPSWNSESCFHLLLLANGAYAKPFPERSIDDPSRTDFETQNAKSLYQSAQKRISCLPHASYELQAKCYFYSGVFLMSSLQPFEAWRMFLQGLAACQSFSTLLSEENASHTSHDKHAEESLYWSCWKSERELRIELGLPDFTSSGFDHPKMFPSLPHNCEHSQLRAWYFYLSEISLWRLETSARKSITDFVAANNRATIGQLADLIADLEAPLAALKDSLPEVLKLTDYPIEYDDVLRFVLRGRFTYNYEILSWPFVYALLSGTCDNDTALKLAVAGLGYHCDRLQLNRRGFYYKHHGTWLMQRSSARSACLLVLASRLLNSDMMPENWHQIVRDTIRMLKYWENDFGVMEGVSNFLEQVLQSDQSPQYAQ